MACFGGTYTLRDPATEKVLHIFDSHDIFVAWDKAGRPKTFPGMDTPGAKPQVPSQKDIVMDAAHIKGDRPFPGIVLAVAVVGVWMFTRS